MAIIEDKYVFEADWFNAQASLVVKLKLTYYLKDRSVELYNNSTKKLFLKRTVIPEISEDDLFIGNKITIFKRDLILKNYAD